jgi:YfiH family protein
MKSVFFHLGAMDPDYRGIMKRHTDFEVAGRSIPADRTVIADQTHSAVVHLCREEDCGAGFGTHQQIPVADAMITDIPHQYLLIRTADCTPILLFDPKRLVVAAVHSGREGTRKNIAGACVNAMIGHYGCNPADIVAHIGAGICEAHYEVSEAMYEEFNASLISEGFCPCTNMHRHLNIRTTIFQQLIRAGLRFINIENVHVCTYEDTGYFSFRRDGTNNRQINLIGIIDE